MRAEELVALCAARGLDLQAMAKQSTAAPPVSDVRRYQRRGVKVVELLPQSQQRAYGKETRSMVEREWSVQELGQAAVGVPRLPFLAACFSWAGEHGHMLELHDGLMHHALQLRRSLRWPFQVEGHDGRRQHYIEHLCAMVLDEDAHPSIFGYRPTTTDSTSIHAIYCGVTEQVWRRSLLDRFERLRFVWWDWHNQAARMIQAQLRDDQHE